jgi:hypothetical protein
MPTPKKLDGRRKENRVGTISTRKAGGDWCAEAFGVSAYAGTKKRAEKQLQGFFALARKNGLSPKSHQIAMNVYGLMRRDNISEEEAIEQIMAEAKEAGPKRAEGGC